MERGLVSLFPLCSSFLGYHVGPRRPGSRALWVLTRHTESHRALAQAAVSVVSRLMEAGVLSLSPVGVLRCGVLQNHRELKMLTKV